MSQTRTEREPQGLAPLLKSGRGDTVSYKQLFETLGKSLSFAEGFVVTSLPRGGLQIVQPAKVPEALLKGYTKEFHAEDRATWHVLQTQKPARGADAFGKEYASSRYVKDFMHPSGLQHLAVAPLSGPLLEGYPGAIHLYRTSEQGEFTDAELAELGQVARQLDAASERARDARRPSDCPQELGWAHRPAVRQFVLNGELKPVLPGSNLDELDDRLKQQILQHARHRMQHLNGSPVAADRLQLPDSRGDLWTFRVVTHKQYPGLGGGPVIFFCLQPESCDWNILRPTDFQADSEISRLVPAMRFMQEEFHRSPTLGEIAKTVHLSPFHFHRRFTELFGLTPKHFLLECQIYEAKRQLMARQKDLAKIAADCGFAHQSHFTSRFKQATGLTPTRWRRLAIELQRRAKEN